MHELSLARGIVELVEEQARAQAFSRVRRIFLQIGALAHVEPHALTFGFDSVSRGTVAEGATLEIARPAGRGTCTDCGEEFVVAARGDGCARCGSHRWLLVDGDQMRVTELEVD